MRYLDLVEAARVELGVTPPQWERIPGYVRDGIISMKRQADDAHRRADAAQEHDLTTVDNPNEHDGIYVARHGTHVRYPLWGESGTQGIVTVIAGGKRLSLRVLSNGTLVVNAGYDGLSIQPTAGNEIRIHPREF